MLITEEFWTIRKKVITENEAKSLGRYDKLWYKDGSLFKRDAIQDGESICSYRYLWDNEVEADVVANETSDFLENSMVIIEKIDYDNNEYCECTRSFIDGELVDSANYLFDSLHRNICQEEINLDTGLPDFSKTQKSFYLYDDDDFSLVETTYNTDGSLRLLYYSPDNLAERFKYNSVLEWEADFFPDTDLSYYATAQLEHE